MIPLRFLSLILILLMVPLSRSGEPRPVHSDDPSTVAAPANDAEPAYRLRLYHTHTDEHIDIVYRRGDTYIPEALEQLNYFLRDSRNGTVADYDPRLFDLLNDLTSSVGRPDSEIDVVCGYRTPET